MWIWQEGEFYDNQSGSLGMDSKRAASGGQCLGNGWAERTEHYVEYKVNLDALFPRTVPSKAATLYLRYARADAGDAYLNVFVDGRPAGPSPSLTLPSTGGWGEADKEWGFVSVPLGQVAKGEHAIRIKSRTDGNRVNIDGFFIGDTTFRLPTNFSAFTRTQEEKTLEEISRREPRIERLVVDRIERQAAILGYESSRTIIDQITSGEAANVLKQTANKPTPYLLNTYDVGSPADYEEDFVWHFLRKEIAFDIPHNRKLGFINPNTDISYFLGFHTIAAQTTGRFPDYDMPTKTRLHLPDLLVEDVEIYEEERDESRPYELEREGAIKATVCFIPVDGATLLTAILFENTAPRPRNLNLYQVVAKPAVDARPHQRFGRSVITSAGALAWPGYSNDNDVAVTCYDEWVGPESNQRVGKLMCALAGTRRGVRGLAGVRYGTGLPKTERSTGFDFSSELLQRDTQRRIARVHPIQFMTMKYRLVLPPNDGDVVLLSLSLQRHADWHVPGPRDINLFKQMTDQEAIENIIRKAVGALEVDWHGLIYESVEKYKAMPEISLPQTNWVPDYYACLELPRVETYSPYKNMDTPFYNFCRAHGQQPYGWWTYGQHAHESLSVFTTAIIDPELAMTHLRGHFKNQSDDGGIPYGVNQNSEPAEITDSVTAPFLMWEAWNTYLWSGDKSFLEEAYEVGKRNHEWWMTERDRTGEGLQHWRDFIETVRDDADLPTWTATNGAKNQEALDLNCYLYVQEKCLAQMASALGLADEATEFEETADRRSTTMNELLWNDKDGCYYGRDLVNEKWADVKDISTSFPLWAGIAPKERAEGLIEQLDSPAFKTAYPLPTLTTNAASFNSEGHWHGSNWVEMSWLPILGLKKYGSYKRAAELAYVNAKMVFDELDLTGHFREYYDTNSGKGAAGCLYDYIWACMPAAMITQIFFGIEPKADGLEVMPALPQDWDDISISKLNIRGNAVSVKITRSRRRKYTSVTVNGSSVTALKNRGVFIPWEQLTTDVNIEIAQPMEIDEEIETPNLFENSETSVSVTVGENAESAEESPEVETPEPEEVEELSPSEE